MQRHTGNKAVSNAEWALAQVAFEDCRDVLYPAFCAMETVEEFETAQARCMSAISNAEVELYRPRWCSFTMRDGQPFCCMFVWRPRGQNFTGSDEETDALRSANGSGPASA